MAIEPLVAPGILRASQQKLAEDEAEKETDKKEGDEKQDAAAPPIAENKVTFVSPQPSTCVSSDEKDNTKGGNNNDVKEEPLYGKIEKPSEPKGRYAEGDVNIHFKSPVRREEKEVIPEEELRKRQEEQMKRFYEGIKHKEI
jgi:hypothetical protein